MESNSSTSSRSSRSGSFRLPTPAGIREMMEEDLEGEAIEEAEFEPPEEQEPNLQDDADLPQRPPPPLNPQEALGPALFRRFQLVMLELMPPNPPTLGFPRIHPQVWAQGAPERRDNLARFTDQLAMLAMHGAIKGEELEAHLGPIEEILELALSWPIEPLDVSFLHLQATKLQLATMAKHLQANKKEKEKPSLEIEATWEQRWFPVLSDDPERTFQDPGPPKLAPMLSSWTLASELFPPVRPERLTVVLAGCTAHLKIRNPLPLPGDAIGYMCDMCNCAGFEAGWQVVADDTGDRDRSCFYKSASGLDICLACATFYCRATQLEWTRFLTSGPSRPASMVAGDGEEEKRTTRNDVFHGAMCQAEVPVPFPVASEFAGDAELLGGATHYKVLETYFTSASCGIRLMTNPAVASRETSSTSSPLLHFTVALAPRGAHACAWVVEMKPNLQAARPHPEPSTGGGEVCSRTIPPAVKALAHDSSVLLLPPADWRKTCTVRAHGIAPCPTERGTSPQKVKQSSLGDDDVNVVDAGIGDCSICLEPLQVDEGDCVQTRCHHWFHVHCIRRLGREEAGKKQSSSDDADHVAFGEDIVCPLCREEGALAPTSKAELLQTNLYDLVVELRPAPPGPVETTIGSSSSSSSVGGGREVPHSSGPSSKISRCSSTTTYVVAVAPLLTQDCRFAHPTDFGGALLFEVTL